MPEKLLFANNIRPIAHEASWFIEPDFENALKIDIERVIDRVQEKSMAQINSTSLSLSPFEETETFIEIYNLLPNKVNPYRIVKAVGFMINTDHPFVDGWTEEHKRYFLDAALEDEILHIQSEYAKYERRLAHFPSGGRSRLHIGEKEMKIKKYVTLQQKLRERASITPPKRRK